MGMDSAATQPVDVLCVDDDQQFLDLVETRLERSFDRIRAETTTSADDAIAALEDDVDCIVTDYRMPAADGLELLKRIRTADPAVPVIFFTGHGSEDIAADAIRAGVTDYLQKGGDESTIQLLGNRVLSLVDRRRADEAAREADRRIREVYERINEAFLGLDADWRVSYLNSKAERLLDVDEDVLGAVAWDEIPLLEGTFETEVESAMNSQAVSAFEFKHPDEDQWFDVTAYPAEDGVSVFLADVTESHAAKEAVAALSSELVDAQAQFRQLHSRLSRPPRSF
jgi:FixJ family two-component response regulator